MGVNRSDLDLETALHRHVAVLTQEIGERSLFSFDKLNQARHYIGQVFEGVGLRVIEQPYDYYGRDVANIIAEPWVGAPASGYYLIGAHYDTVPGSPGADDNASAVAVLLELGRRLALSLTPSAVCLVAFTLEEPPAFMTPLQGSRVFVREQAHGEGPLLGAIILEMVGFTSLEQGYPWLIRWAGYPDQGNFIGVVGNQRSRGFGSTLLNGFRQNPKLPVESLFVLGNGTLLPAIRLSDHASFWDQGWPAVMVTDTAFFRNPNYHAPSDTIETLDFAFMAELVNSLELALYELLTTPHEHLA